MLRNFYILPQLQQNDEIGGGGEMREASCNHDSGNKYVKY
jgi:hypothetical protein